MGKDLVAGGRNKSVRRTAPKSENPYVRVLFDSYSYIARRAESDFAKKVAHRLCLSKSNRPPVSVSSLARVARAQPEKTIVVVATITNDERLLELPAMKVCALRFTRTARARIVKAGGQCLTLDALAMENPKGNDCVLFQGKRSHRAVARYFGAAGKRHSSTRTKTGQKRNNADRCRGFHGKGW